VQASWNVGDTKNTENGSAQVPEYVGDARRLSVKN